MSLYKLPFQISKKTLLDRVYKYEKLEKENEELEKENKQLKEEIQKLNDYIEDKDNRINHPLKCNFYEIHKNNKSQEGEK